MKRLIFIFLISGFSVAAYNQVIKGTVFDNDTKSIINFASIYFNGTVTGTATDSKGNFELDISKHNSMPLTISAIGYYSVTLTDLTSTKPLMIYLSPKVFELNEVVITSKSNDRERKSNLKLFKKEFLGVTANASECEIRNEDEIKFLYDPESNILKAFALKPILIENKALGYTISYFLDRFEYNKDNSTFLFRGNIIFKDNLSAVDSLKQILNRQEAYLGSRMHLFRTLWNGNLKAEKFTVENIHNENLNFKDLVIQKDIQTKALTYPENLIISYNMLHVSNIVFVKKPVLFDKNGYYDPTAISWEGEMARQRIADLLPIEYSLTNY